VSGLQKNDARWMRSSVSEQASEHFKRNIIANKIYGTTLPSE
jgi:hypothetical protein